MHRRACCVVALVLGWPSLSWAAPAGEKVAIIRPVAPAPAMDLFDEETDEASDGDEPAEDVGAGTPGNDQGGDAGEDFSEACRAASCAPCCEDSCQPCPAWPFTLNPKRGFWGRAEALGFWVRGSHAPALVSTSPIGTPLPIAGVLPAATVLFPTMPLDPVGRAGVRTTLGYWLDDKEEKGFQGNFFLLDDPQHPYSVSSNGGTILARPYFNTAQGAEAARLVAFPGQSGSIGVNSSSKIFGAEGNLREAFYQTGNTRFDLLAGYRYFQFNDALGIQANSQFLRSASTIATHDSFSTKNTFNGAQLGVIMQRGHQRWGYDVVGKLALGSVWQHVSINGTTTSNVGGTPTVREGGFLALPSNSGSFGRKACSFLPELNTNLYYQMTPIWRFNVGYTLLYVTNVVRSADQIDRAINPANFMGSATPPPVFAFHGSSLWVQGISLGLEARF